MIELKCCWLLCGVVITAAGAPVHHEEEDAAPEKNSKILCKRRQGSHGEAEYLCKFQGISYLHAEWLPRRKVLRGGKRNNLVVKDFLDRWQNEKDKMRVQPFDPAFVTPEAILKHVPSAFNPKTGKREAKVFVKWYNLGQDENTWEFASDVFPDEANPNQAAERGYQQTQQAIARGVRFSSSSETVDSQTLKAFQA